MALQAGRGRGRELAQWHRVPVRSYSDLSEGQPQVSLPCGFPAWAGSLSPSSRHSAASFAHCSLRKSRNGFHPSQAGMFTLVLMCIFGLLSPCPIVRPGCWQAWAVETTEALKAQLWDAQAEVARLEAQQERRGCAPARLAAHPFGLRGCCLMVGTFSAK